MINKDFIKLRNISKRFNDIIAVDSLDLDGNVVLDLTGVIKNLLYYYLIYYMNH